MAKINLLPWREELREQRNKEYFVMLGIVAALAAALVFLVNSYYSDSVVAQNYRNAFVEKESQVLDAKIDEIRSLQDTRTQLIERMELIQALQGNRPVIVRVFDEVARSVPEDLFFKSLSIVGENVTISGVAKSNNRVAALMRNFDASEWFTDPELKKVQATAEGVNEFEISMKRIDPKASAEEEK